MVKATLDLVVQGGGQWLGTGEGHVAWMHPEDRAICVWTVRQRAAQSPSHGRVLHPGWPAAWVRMVTAPQGVSKGHSGGTLSVQWKLHGNSPCISLRPQLYLMETLVKPACCLSPPQHFEILVQCWQILAIYMAIHSLTRGRHRSSVMALFLAEPRWSLRILLNPAINNAQSW